MSARLTLVLIGLIGFCPTAVAEPGAVPAPTSMTLDASKLKLGSANALVLDANAGQPIYAKDADTVTPIASVTKLMTAMVVLDAAQSLDEPITVGVGDVDLYGLDAAIGLVDAVGHRSAEDAVQQTLKF